MSRKHAPEVIRTQKRILPCSLSDAEVQARGTALAHLERALEEHELATKTVRTASNKAKAALVLQISGMAVVVRDREELRQVEVLIQRGKGELVEVVRSDTGEVVETRRATEDENQAWLPFSVPEDDELSS